MGKHIRKEGPDSHLVKQGTPSMGGLLVIGVVADPFDLIAGEFRAAAIAPLLSLSSSALLGTSDDYLNAKTGEGIRIRQKLLWQVVVAGVIAYQIQDLRHHAPDGAVRRRHQHRAVGYILFAALAIVAAPTASTSPTVSTALPAAP